VLDIKDIYTILPLRMEYAQTPAGGGLNYGRTASTFIEEVQKAGK